METSEARDHVHPLPPENGTRPDARAASLRRALPLLAGGSILVAFVAVIGLSAGTDRDAVGTEPPTTSAFVTSLEASTIASTTPTTPFAPMRVAPVEEPVDIPPGLGDRLVAAVSTQQGFVEFVRWQSGRVPIRTEGPDGFNTTLDADGSLVATLWRSPMALEDSPFLLSVGPIVLESTPQFLGATSYAWHAAEPGALALAGRQPADDTHGVFVMRFDRAGVLQTVVRVADAEPSWTVVAYSDTGILIQDLPNGKAMVHLLRDDGTMTSTEGLIWTVSDSLLLGSVDDETGGSLERRAWTWNLDHVAQLPRYLEDVWIGQIECELGEIVLGSTCGTLSPDGRHSATVVSGDTSSIVVRGDDTEGPRVHTLPSLITDVLFVTNDRLAAFSPSDGLLFLIDWRTGARHELDLQGVELLDVLAPGA